MSTLETIVADFGNNLSPKTATIVASADRPLGVGDVSPCPSGPRACEVAHAKKTVVCHGSFLSSSFQLLQNFALYKLLLSPEALFLLIRG